MLLKSCIMEIILSVIVSFVKDWQKNQYSSVLICIYLPFTVLSSVPLFSVWLPHKSFVQYV